MLQINNVAQCYENRVNFISFITLLQRGSIIEYDAVEFHWIILLLEYKEILDDIPYNPRWPMKQMIDKLLTYVMENAVKKFQTNSIKNNRFQ